LTTFPVRCWCDGTVRFKRQHGSSSAVFDIELAQNVFDVLANGAGLCAENNANIVVALPSESQKRTSASRDVSANDAKASRLR
jgi:hypothetical protein